MRSFIIAPLFAAAAFAQSSTSASESEVSTAPTSSYVYSNPLTAYTTQTDSEGRITGRPPVETDVGTANTDVGQAETSIAPLPSGHTVADIFPAGLPTGLHTVTIGNATSTVVASINNSTTIVLSHTSTARSTPVSGVASPTGGSGSGNSTGTGSGSGSGTGSESSTGPTSTAAAAHIKVAGGALMGAAGFFAAML